MSLEIIERFVLDETGPTAVEYAVMLALIIAASVATIDSLGGASHAFWERNLEAVQATQ
jgi:pilus assembly protein Flp/PilA